MPSQFVKGTVCPLRNTNEANINNNSFQKLCPFTHNTVLQGGTNMTGTDLCVNKPHSVPVIFEPLELSRPTHFYPTTAVYRSVSVLPGEHGQINQN